MKFKNAIIPFKPYVRKIENPLEKSREQDNKKTTQTHKIYEVW